MYGIRYFCNRLFAGRFFPHYGLASAELPAVTFTAATRSLEFAAATRSLEFAAASSRSLEFAAATRSLEFTARSQP